MTTTTGIRNGLMQQHMARNIMDLGCFWCSRPAGGLCCVRPECAAVFQALTYGEQDYLLDVYNVVHKVWQRRTLGQRVWAAAPSGIAAVLTLAAFTVIFLPALRLLAGGGR